MLRFAWSHGECDPRFGSGDFKQQVERERMLPLR